MKKLLYTIIAFLTLSNSYSQTNYTPTGRWRYVNGSDTINISFKSDQMNAGGAVQPILIGFHEYIKNGQLIESTMQYNTTSHADKKYSIIIFNYIPNDIRNDGSMKDLTLNYTHYIILKKINLNTMTVRLTSMQDRRRNGTVTGYTLPRSFQLTRI